MQKIIDFLASMYWYAILAAAVVLSLCALSARAELCDLAPEWRQRNWGNPGSCGHASTCSALRWVEELEKADVWRHKYAHGECLVGLCQKLKANGIPYIATTDGDVRLLDYADQARRMAVIFLPSENHVVNFVGYAIGKSGNKCAAILDNNNTGHFSLHVASKWIPYWQDQGGNDGGCAVVILSGTVPPPVPE